VDRIPFTMQWGPWDETHRRWKQQGMRNDGDWHTMFDFDSGGIGTGVDFGICPPFEREQVDEDDEHITFRDEHGVLQRMRKDGTSMSEWLDYPVKDRRTWEEHKRRFDPSTPERFPADWDKRAAELKGSDEMIGIGFYPYGFFAGARTMMGAEACMVAMAEDPELIEDINGTLCDLWCTLLERVSDEARVDAVHAWEDMAFKSGSLISPAMFERYLTPYYQRLMGLADQRGATIRLVDSDGYMHGLTPLFLEAGLTGIFPYEVQAGNDLTHLLNAHPDLRALGHIDKRAMTRDKAAVEAEIERLKPIADIGRFIPHMDHGIPPDVSWENYQQMVWCWKELVGKE
jgi:uroporphyrinogen decarboxylase